jgi:hypothetical protein
MRTLITDALKPPSAKIASPDNDEEIVIASGKKQTLARVTNANASGPK